MRQRCSKPKDAAFKNYGGRGISVCEEWQKSFREFFNWALANGYRRGLDIDRRDNNGNYEPGNCRFVTRAVNCNIDSRFTFDHLREFRTLFEGRYRKEVRVGDIEITSQYVANIDKLLGKTIQSEGSVSGRIERLDAHETHKATLFVPTGEQVLCIFDDATWPIAIDAFEKRTVTIHGKMTYQLEAAIPSKVRVSSIEVHPAESELPSAADVRGLFGSGATGGKSVTDFIRAIRDDEGR